MEAAEKDLKRYREQMEEYKEKMIRATAIGRAALQTQSEQASSPRMQSLPNTTTQQLSVREALASVDTSYAAKSLASLQTTTADAAAAAPAAPMAMPSFDSGILQQLIQANQQQELMRAAAQQQQNLINFQLLQQSGLDMASLQQPHQLLGAGLLGGEQQNPVDAQMLALLQARQEVSQHTAPSPAFANSSLLGDVLRQQAGQRRLLMEQSDGSNVFGGLFPNLMTNSQQSSGVAFSQPQPQQHLTGQQGLREQQLVQLLQQQNNNSGSQQYPQQSSEGEVPDGMPGQRFLGN